MSKLSILLVYDYFYPAVLAGGPTVSCENLLVYFGHRINFSVFTTNRDLDGSELFVKSDKWIKYKGISDVLYAKKLWCTKGFIEIGKTTKPDIIYINGVFSFVGVIIPLLISPIYFKYSKIIISPRGMLLKSARKEKRLKKLFYLSIFKFLVSINRVTWHVTSVQEKRELLLFLSNSKEIEVFIAGNIPTFDINFVERNRCKNTLKLVTIALVSPMKNILQVIRALKLVDCDVSYAIYGAIKDAKYWDLCLEEINLLPKSVTVVYKGIANKSNISSILTQYDYYIQPSKSENFGHSIYEALISGMPVLTSYNTPWDVSGTQAGWNIDPANIEEITDALVQAKRQTNDDFRKMSINANNLAKQYLNNENFDAKYSRMFRITH